MYTLLLVSAICSSNYAAIPEGNELSDQDCFVSGGLSGDDWIFVQDNNTDVSIFPNPVKSFATISFTYQNIDKISILNIVGREIKTITPEAGKQEVKVSLVDLQPGVYFLAAYYQGSTLVTKKFLKEE